ncbi:MAG TPA: hypothetical protein VNJ02_03935 [Vicinamibacterales bacterium]|nr:hypothetical protein [Vicinamibacterales bacterium]
MLTSTAFGLAIALIGLIGPTQPPDRQALAGYRLTPAVFATFQHASREIATIVGRDASLRSAPLFSQDIVQAADLVEAATQLEARLTEHVELAAALRTAKVTPRDYTIFALSLLGARLAFGFVEAGTLRSVPAGAAADNVTFVRAHRAAVDEVLTLAGVEMK